MQQIMDISEKELEDILCQNLSRNIGRNVLYDRGFPLPYPPDEISTFKVYRQINFGDYGIADIITFCKHYEIDIHEDDNGKKSKRIYPDVEITIYELKSREAEVKDFEQLSRYRTAVEEIIRNGKISKYIHVNSYVVAPDINTGHYLMNHSKLNMINFSYDVTGIEFNQTSGNWYRGDGVLTMNDINLKEYNNEEIY